jgi:hypothetical protein
MLPFCSRALARAGRLAHTSRHAFALCKSMSSSANPPSGIQAEVHASETLLSKLKDPTLIRTAGYIGGEWINAIDGATYEVHSVLLSLPDCLSYPIIRAGHQPSDGASNRHPAIAERRRNQGRHRSCALRPPAVAQPNRQGARRHPPQASTRPPPPRCCNRHAAPACGGLGAASWCGRAESEWPRNAGGTRRS